MRGLAYAHPAWMVVSLIVVAIALRAGLALRRARRIGRSGRAALRRRHLRWAKPGVALVAAGFVAGPASMIWLRAREPFDTAHALLGGATFVLFMAAAILGRRLEKGRSRAVDVHALFGAVAVLLAALAAVAGFGLLP